MAKPDEPEAGKPSAVTRRGFLKGAGAVLSSGVVAGAEVLEAAQTSAGPKILGPGSVPITLRINGVSKSVNVEPRFTLLEVLRDELALTGAKKVCDRAACGACTVIVGDKAAYACAVLAIEAQGKEITTVEGLAPQGQLHAIQQAFVEHDAQQCGYCTPGFVVACKAFLDKHPNPTEAQIKKGLGGNLCRCGTYAGITRAVLQVGRQKKGGKTNA
jgi:xanthine dehydrogenase YagT iron-sulfur-binding subunit